MVWGRQEERSVSPLGTPENRSPDPASEWQVPPAGAPDHAGSRHNAHALLTAQHSGLEAESLSHGSPLLIVVDVDEETVSFNLYFIR